MLKNTLLLSLFSIGCLAGFSEQKLPVLESDSNFVRVKIDGNIVAVWSIDPDTKPWTEPDVFAIERSFSEKKVVYLSDHDSLTFNVKPGDQYDFNILIKNRGTYLLRLTTYGEPVFLNRKILISIFLVLVITVGLGWAKRNSFSTIFLLRLGIITPLLFWLATITGGYIHGNYNHLHNVVSELGAIGTRSEIFMSTAEFLISILSIFSVIGFYKACKETGLNVIPVLTILSLSISMIWAAIFPMHHELHGTLGPIPLIVNAGVLLSVFLWRGKKFGSLRLVSFVSFLIMMLILLRTIPNLRGNWEGLIQRLFYLGWSFWSIALSLIFMKMPEIKNPRAYKA
ncbi:MAG TPA: DUF998 domain-containing protein [Puia sp.]|nr:DUF998 domain-containing protein [Puia sp.]